MLKAAILKAVIKIDVLKADTLKAVKRLLLVLACLSSGAAMNVVMAAQMQTYVIPSYGGTELLPAVRQQLDNSRDGGSVSVYQHQLILRTTPHNYQAVQALLSQIDQAPQMLTLSVRVGSHHEAAASVQQGQVVINRSGVSAAGGLQQSQAHSQQHSLYQVATLSGRSASISTGQLLALAQPYLLSQPIHQRQQRYQQRYYGHAGVSNRVLIIGGQRLLPTTQGIRVTPRLLADGQVQVEVAQQQDQLTGDQSIPVHRQSLTSHVVVTRGQWVEIGRVDASQDSSQYRTQQHSGSASSWYPIAIRVE